MADGRSDGAISADGRIAGSYVHGLLDLAGQRAAWLARIGGTGRGIDQHAAVDRALDEIAALLEIHLDIDALVAMSQMAQD
jgi:adenosylcobyric acid synthase